MAKVGRPRKDPNAEPKIEDLVEAPQYFERTMQEFFRRGGMPALRRWLIAAQDRQKAILIANIMVDRFADKLWPLIPEDPNETP